ncbi:MAG: hypothetical protein IZT59_10060 [Verrucomicrobia bacterium]|nr:hypothetical protein [Verrucomicrobiota bacterium]
MISGKQLLPVLIGAALGVGGWMYGIQNGGGSGAVSAGGLEDQLRIAEDEIGMLQKENESLRSLAQGGGEVSIPAEMIELIEKDYDLEFLSTPVFHRIASEELGYRIEAAIESRMGPQGIDDRNEAFQRIGWLRPEDRLLEQMVAIRSVGALGWFDEGTGDAWVTERFDLKNVPDQAAALRLLVRILLNQHFPAMAAYPGDDLARAREALHAGAASGAETRFFARSAQAIGFVPMNENGAAARLLMTLPDFLQGLAMFPAVEGKGLGDTLFVKGKEAFAEGMRNPPENTLEVVFPGEKGRGGKLSIAGIEDEVYLEESAGYLGLNLWVAEMGDVGLAGKIAGSWIKDGYVLFADGESSSGLVWDVAFESEKAADLFQAVALDRVAAMSNAGKIPALGEVIETEGRFFRVVRIDQEAVRFINAATRETATKGFEEL